MGNNNNKTLKLAAIFLPLLLALVAVGFAYGKYEQKVERLQETAIKTQTNTESIVEIKKDIEYIKQAVNRIEEKIDNNRRP